MACPDAIAEARTLTCRNPELAAENWPAAVVEVAFVPVATLMTVSAVHVDPLDVASNCSVAVNVPVIWNVTDGLVPGLNTAHAAAVEQVAAEVVMLKVLMTCARAGVASRSA